MKYLTALLFAVSIIAPARPQESASSAQAPAAAPSGSLEPRESLQPAPGVGPRRIEQYGAPRIQKSSSEALRRGPGASSTDFAKRVQQKYDRIRDFSASFVHSYRGGVLRKQITERGRVLIKKPGKMRWTYESPERKVFVSDGRKLYAYVPADRQVTIATVPAGDDASTPVLFLAGKGDLTRDFAVSYTDVAEAPKGSVALKLVPRRKEREYDWLALVVDAGLRLQMLIATDAQGGRSAFTFGNLKENVGLADKEFAFQIPRGVEVISDGQR